jgi:DNA-binding transcriptional LysR family regulator
VRTRNAGTVRVAAPPILASLILPPLIARFQQQHPDIAVRPVDATADSMVGLVEQDEVDFALGADRPVGPTVQRMRLYDSPLVVWCAREHPLAASPSLSWSELGHHAVIAPGLDAGHRIETALQDSEGRPRFIPAYAVHNITTALGMAASGLGVTVAPRHVEVIAGVMGLVPRELNDPRVVREISLFKPVTRDSGDAAACFERFVVAELH